MTSERSLTVDAGGKVIYSPQLRSEINAWLLSGMLKKPRTEAVAYLLKEALNGKSDGIECCHTREGLMPHGSCMCARLLMLLHDVSEEEISREMFARLTEFLGKKDL